MSGAGSAHTLEEILERLDQQTTVFGDVKSAGHDVQDATSTALPPNFRTSVIKNSDLLTLDEVDNEITFESPLYKSTVTDNDELIERSTERNTYIPGFTSTCGFAFKIDTQPPQGKVMPRNFLFEGGYGGLSTGDVTGFATGVTGRDKDGVFLHLENGAVDLRIYKGRAGSDPVKRIPRSNWEFDPFASDTFDYNVNRFLLVRFIFDLYGAGDATMFFRMRNKDGKSVYKEIATISIRDDPLLEIFDMPVSTMFKSTGSMDQDVDIRIGPRQFYNTVDSLPSLRTKSATYRGISVNDSLSSNGATVMRLYRLDPNRVEAVTRVSELAGVVSGEDAQTQLRDVHRDHITFPNNFDPDNNDNWIAPPDQRVKDTSLQEADTAVGNITIDTHTDGDGETKLRGRQNTVNNLDAGQGQTAGGGAIEAETFMNELLYLALLGRQNSPSNSEIDRTTVRWAQRW